MICSTSSSSSAAISIAALILLLLPGCALLGGLWGRPIEFRALVPDHPGPHVLGSAPIRWTASATGGRGELTYEFRTARGWIENVAQTGTRSTWDWTPKTPGTYRVKVTVRDSWGLSVDSGWSQQYVILPLAGREAPIAVLPIENLSGERAPAEAVLRRIRAGLEGEGFRIVDEETLEAFLHRHRVRVASGLDREEALAIRAATGAEAVLITSFAAYQERPPPHASLFARLVSTGEDPQILWMDSVALSGEDPVRLLGLGRIEEVGSLLENLIDGVTDALSMDVPEPASGGPGLEAEDGVDAPGRVVPAPRFEDAIDPGLLETGSGGIPLDTSPPSTMGPEDARIPPEPRRRYAPRTVFGSLLRDPGERYSVAVVPFVNRSERKNAGQIMALHFVEELHRIEGLRVVDPGLVREEMLRYRTVIPEGPSLETGDILSDENSLGVDLLLSGTVFDYGGAVVPKVEFSLEILDAAAREVIWTSRSYNDGEEAVFFLDVGRVYTAHRLASDMARAAVAELSR